jgi:hypothetical protein
MTERDESFDEMLDECYEPYEIMGMMYYPSVILFECDPIAYQVSVSDWHDSECKDGRHTYEFRGKAANAVCVWCSEDEEAEEYESEYESASGHPLNGACTPYCSCVV